MEKIGNVEDVPSVEEVILGVDTHLDLRVAVALDQLGREAWARRRCRPRRGAMRGSFVGRRVSASWGASG
jgi:hypothetical protein